MALKTKVKAGNITNLSDARYCAGMGVDWLSFPIHMVNSTLFKEITNWVTGPQLILELNASAEINTIDQYPVDIIEISYLQLKLMDQLTTKTWMVNLPVSEWIFRKAELIKNTDKIDYVILHPDIQDVQVIREIATTFKVIINQTESYSINQLLDLPIEGINILGDDELKPGLKDYEKLSSVFEALEVND